MTKDYKKIKTETVTITKTKTKQNEKIKNQKQLNIHLKLRLYFYYKPSEKRVQLVILRIFNVSSATLVRAVAVRATMGTKG